MEQKEFEEAAKDGVEFPLFSSVRVTAQKSAGRTQLVVVEAEQQQMLAPTSANMELVALKQYIQPPAGMMRFGSLADMAQLPLAGLSVSEKPCSIAIALVGSTAKSTLQQIGDGYQIETKKVLDVGLQTGIKHEIFSGSVLSVCTLSNLVRFKLDPARPGKPSYFIVLVSSASAPGSSEPLVVVDQIQPIKEDELETVQKCLRKLHVLANSGKHGSRRVNWPDEVRPVKQAKIRRLSASPTSYSLPDDA
jgi:hypothetical protein